MTVLPNNYEVLDRRFINVNQVALKLLDRPLISKDIWHTIEDLGLEVNQHDKTLTISFGSIQQDWLKLITKLYIIIRSQRKLSAKCLSNEISSINCFSQFIEQKSIFNINHINEQLFDEYDYYLMQKISA